MAGVIGSKDRVAPMLPPRLKTKSKKPRRALPKPTLSGAPALPRKQAVLEFDVRATVPMQKKATPPPLPTAKALADRTEPIAIDVEAVVEDRRKFERDMLPNSWAPVPQLPAAKTEPRAPALPPMRSSVPPPPSSWTSADGSLVPHELYRPSARPPPRLRSGDSMRWLAAAVVLSAGAVIATTQLLPDSGSLGSELAQQDGVPIAEVFVDGATPPAINQSVKLKSAHEGVTVAIDGEPRGALPISVDDLQPGEHTLRFEAERFAPLDQTITIAQGETVTILAPPLKLETGLLRVDLKTPGARVLLGNKDTKYGRKPLFGPWPKMLELRADRDWEIVAARPGFKPRIAPITFDADGHCHVDVELEALPYMWDGDIYE
jgi:hypothetical protein